MKLSNPKNRSRLAALNLLENQLKRGTKPVKDENGKTTTEMVELSDKDKTRIKREIEILNKRTIKPENA